MVKYVVGFLFDGKGNVALIRKNRPEWQKGRINGIGGKVEIDETPKAAMRREFYEEAGMDVSDWREFCLIKGMGYELYCFASNHSDAQNKTKSMTDEIVCWYPAKILPSNIIAQLEWLVPMAKHEHPIRAEVIHEYPTC